MDDDQLAQFMAEQENKPATTFDDNTTGTTTGDKDDSLFGFDERSDVVKVTSSSEKKGADSPRPGWLKIADPRVVDLIYWRNLKKTGAVFGAVLFLLLSLGCYSLVTVVSYLSLAILTITISFRGYKSVLQAVQKTSDQHPFKEYLDMELEFPRETVDKAVDKVEHFLNWIVKELRRLFLVEDVVDSLKFFLLMWVLTYVGAWFEILTLVILAFLGVFTIPKVYEMYQEPIDNYIGVARSRLTTVLCQIQERVPFLKKKAKSQ